MGEIYMLGDFAMGVRRARGWKRWVSLAMALLLLGLAGLGVVYSVIVLAAG
jgi:hypothetical protein